MPHCLRQESASVPLFRVERDEAGWEEASGMEEVVEGAAAAAVAVTAGVAAGAAAAAVEAGRKGADTTPVRISTSNSA
jgi:hypothetical protein